MIMNGQNVDTSLAMNALDVIPTPTEHANKIVGLVKHSGSVTGYQLDNGQILSKEEGVALAKNGGIQGVGVSHRNGKEYLKSLPDQTDSNNLSHLPTVSQ